MNTLIAAGLLSALLPTQHIEAHFKIAPNLQYVAACTALGPIAMHVDGSTLTGAEANEFKEIASQGITHAVILDRHGNLVHAEAFRCAP